MSRGLSPCYGGVISWEDPSLSSRALTAQHSEHASSGRRGLRFAGVDNEIEQPLVSANSNHVSRRYVTEYGIGEFKPKTHFLRIAGKELSNEIGNICDFTQSLRHRLRNMRIEAHR